MMPNIMLSPWTPSDLLLKPPLLLAVPPLQRPVPAVHVAVRMQPLRNPAASPFELSEVSETTLGEVTSTETETESATDGDDEITPALPQLVSSIFIPTIIVF
jgi:hypothetical protein